MPSPLTRGGVGAAERFALDPCMPLADRTGQTHWVTALPTGLVVAPEGVRGQLEGELTFSVAGRWAWPWSWAEPALFDTLASAASHGKMPLTPAELDVLIPLEATVSRRPAEVFPRTGHAGLSELVQAYLGAIEGLGDGWRPAISEGLRDIAMIMADEGLLEVAEDLIGRTEEAPWAAKVRAKIAGGVRRKPPAVEVPPRPDDSLAELLEKVEASAEWPVQCAARVEALARRFPAEAGAHVSALMARAEEFSGHYDGLRGLASVATALGLVGRGEQAREFAERFSLADQRLTVLAGGVDVVAEAVELVGKLQLGARHQAEAWVELAVAASGAERRALFERALGSAGSARQDARRWAVDALIAGAVRMGEPEWGWHALSLQTRSHRALNIRPLIDACVDKHMGDAVLFLLGQLTTDDLNGRAAYALRAIRSWPRP